ncbi:Uma2 family endonuclease [Nocardiopsis potens]|uniref:Uma2 family endonuclease n=1 Tax=Nocardiopsis potens TaxID=1246458 RepID=UPI000369B9F6|nr:Uma2 family endonuclease [Nocardiopsis potens]
MSAPPATEERPATGEHPPAEISAENWPIPPERGWTSDDLDRIADLPPHTELIDGSLVLVSPQMYFHMVMLRLLERTLEAASPEHLKVCREMTVTLGPKNRPEPDTMVIRADAVTEMDQTSFPPEAVVLAVEIVSPDSEERDRVRKPQLYAEAGIKHFWRVEKEDGAAVVYVYELDPATKAYVANGVHRERLKLPVPFDIDIDLTEIDRM